MPPKRKLRKIVAPPNFKGFKPYGTTKESIDIIELLYEEYEAIKLADYEFMTHLEASKLMGISRATFARIYETGRRKIAKALVEASEIKTVFGIKITEDLMVGIVSTIMTILILVASEIIPKTIGATYWKQLGAHIQIRRKI